MDWIQVLQQFGLPIGILAVLAWGGYHITIYLGKRLFDEDRGLITLAVRAHQSYLAATELQLREQTESQRKIGLALDSISERSKSAVPLADFQAAAVLHSEVIRCVGQLVSIAAARGATAQEMRRIHRLISRMDRLTGGALRGQGSMLLDDEDDMDEEV